jgi:sulfur carrier protein
VRVLVNGESRDLPDGCNISDLLKILRGPGEMQALPPGVAADAAVAVAVNLHVVPRKEHAARTLREGDRVDVVTAVGGG